MNDSKFGNGNSLTPMQEFIREMEKYSENASDENVAEVLQAGADLLVEDLRKLPKPRSMKAGSRTHMLDVMDSEKDKSNKVKVGWVDKWFYGVFQERGTRYQRAQKHLSPTWEQNKNKYYAAMQKKLMEV